MSKEFHFLSDPATPVGSASPCLSEDANHSMRTSPRSAGILPAVFCQLIHEAAHISDSASQATTQSPLLEWNLNAHPARSPQETNRQMKPSFKSAKNRNRLSLRPHQPSR